MAASPYPDRFEVEEKLRKGIYKLVTKSGRRSDIWKHYLSIATKDGNTIEGYVHCCGCKKLLKCDGKKTSNLNRHSCYLMKTADNGNTSPNVEKLDGRNLTEKEQKEQHDIRAKLESGEYKLYDQPKGKSPIWLLYARICDKNDVAVMGYVQCRQCRNLFKFDGMRTANLSRHPCFTSWMLNGSEGAKKPRLDEEEFDADADEGDEENSSISSSYNNSYMDDDTTNTSFDMDSIQKSIEAKLANGIYKVADNQMATSPIWSTFGFITKDNGSMLDAWVCCRQCKQILPYKSSNLNNLYTHNCGPGLDEVVVKMEEEFLDESYTISGYDEIPTSTSLEIKEEIVQEQGATYTSLISNAAVLNEDLMSVTTTIVDVSQITVLSNEPPVTTSSFGAKEKMDNSSRTMEEGLETPLMVSSDKEDDPADQNLEAYNSPPAKYSREEVIENIRSGSFKLIDKQNVKSKIWSLFAIVARSDDDTIIEGYVYCRRCQKLLKNLSLSTSNLCRHSCVLAMQKMVTTSEREDILVACSKWLIEDCRDVSIVEGPGFRKLVSAFLQLGSKMGENLDIEQLLPDPQTVAKRLQFKANEKRTLFKEDLKECLTRASLSIDFWPDNRLKKNFFCVTLHYAENFQLRDIVLGIKSLDFHRTNELAIRGKLKSLMDIYDIPKDQDFIYVIENGNMAEKALPPNSKVICSGHLLSQVLEMALEQTPELGEITNAAKSIVRYFKKNYDRILLANPSNTRRSYAGRYEHLKLITEQWQRVQERLATIKSECNLSDDTITRLGNLVSLCQKFEFIFKALQESRLPSLCFVVPSINRLRVVCESQDCDDPALKAFKSNILKTLDTIWVNTINIWHKAAYFLYPPANEEPDNQSNEVKEFCLKKMKMFTNLVVEESPSEEPSTSQAASTSTSTSTSTTDKDDLSFFFPNLCKKPNPSSTKNAEDELRRYSRENVVIDENFEVCQWWRANTSNYPLLSQLALQILAIPASTKGLEKLRPLTKYIIYEKGNGLKTKSVDNILFLNSFSRLTQTEK